MAFIFIQKLRFLFKIFEKKIMARGLVLAKEVTELNGKVQFSSKVHFFGEL